MSLFQFLQEEERRKKKGRGKKKVEENALAVIDYSDFLVLLVSQAQGTKAMIKKKLGWSDVQVSAVCLGTMTFG